MKVRKLKKRDATFELGSSQLNISDFDMNDFLELKASYFEGLGEPIVESNLRGDVLEISFSTRNTRNFPFTSTGKRKYEARLGRPDIETDMDIDLGSGVVSVDLDELVLDKVNLDIGSGVVNIELASSSLPSDIFNIDMGSGSVVIMLPSETGIKTEYRIGSGNLSIEGNSLKGAGTYTSSNYSTSSAQVELNVDMGSGSLNISTD